MHNYESRSDVSVGTIRLSELLKLIPQVHSDVVLSPALTDEGSPDKDTMCAMSHIYQQGHAYAVAVAALETLDTTKGESQAKNANAILATNKCIIPVAVHKPLDVCINYLQHMQATQCAFSKRC